MSIRPTVISLILFAVSCLTSLQANLQIGIVTASNYVGEREVAWRIKIAAENLGWTVFFDEDGGRQIKHLKKLDWVISLLQNSEFFTSSCPIYQTIFHPFGFLDDTCKLLPCFEKFDGFLLTIKDRETIENGLMAKNKEFNFITFYPSVYTVPYTEVPLRDLVTTVPVWSNRLTDKKFQTLYKLLSKTGTVKFYGVNRNKGIIPKGYMGKIPFDGVSVINILQQHGIVLIMHSDVQNKEGIPTSRIFEAAAASTVIICDENSFVKEHFGDSVFYIDTSLPAQGIFNQIQEHLNKIRQNPNQALNMAKTAHEIFMDRFEMSAQLLKLEALHREIQLKKGG